MIVAVKHPEILHPTFYSCTCVYNLAETFAEITKTYHTECYHLLYKLVNMLHGSLVILPSHFLAMKGQKSRFIKLDTLKQKINEGIILVNQELS